MCGVVGFITPRKLVTRDLVMSMARAVVHRGPDDEGCWMDPEMGLALGHCRLSIVDLSSGGHQPMRSRCGRYVISFNGEIYNFMALRKEIDAHLGPAAAAWRGQSDTEVMLEAIAAWGIEDAITRLVGMFAFALWDRERRVLHLGRDRLGEKPLYYGQIGGSFVFGSELKALRLFPGEGLEVDRDAVADLLRFGYVPSPKSIYRGICKLEPATLLAISVAPCGAYNLGTPYRYWSLDHSRGVPIDGVAPRAEDLIERLDSLLAESVKQQMIADVPLGAFLSGGIDSSTVVALMQSQSGRRVRTFTIGFLDAEYDEARHARAVAEHLGTDHTELFATPGEAAAIIPKLPEMFDEPFADSSQIPTYIVSRLTRTQVKVSLSGDGGDELFGGYPRYRFAEALWRRTRLLPDWCRRLLSATVEALSERAWDDVLRWTLPSRARGQVNGHRLHRVAQIIDAGTFGEMYLRLVSQWQRSERMVLGARERTHLHRGSTADAGCPYLEQMRRIDLESYLPDDILVKVDRASMSVGLESRAPMLDHRVVELAWRLPLDMLVHGGESKWILRRVLDRYVPRALVDRPKAGFRIPLASWLRTELRDWAEPLLDVQAIRSQGYLDPAPIRAMWEQHVSGQYDRQAYLWNVLMFQAWLGARGHVGRPSASSDRCLVG